jgi:large subunit ribosomal protein L21
MYAIVKTGGKQYRVERGQRLLVERLPAKEGADVALEPILYRSEEAIFDRDGLAGVTVTARVLGHVRGEKLRVFKFKPKRGYKRRTGHRQELTRIEVTEIAAGTARKTAKPARAKRAEAGGAAGPAGAKDDAPKGAAKAPAAKDEAAKGAAKAQAAKGEAAKGAAKAPAAKGDAPKGAAKAPAARPAAAKPKAAKDAAETSEEKSPDGA